MRSFGAVSPKFWTGRTGKGLRKDRDCQVVALYLMTAPASHQTGIYYLPITYMATDTGIPLQGASEALQRLIEGGFCQYDEDAEWIWVREMAIWQIGEPTSEADKRVIGVQHYFAELPDLEFLPGFLERYGPIFHLQPRGLKSKNPEGHTSPLNGASNPHRSHTQEEDQEEDHIKDKVLRVFHHWRTEWKKPRAKLDAKRTKAIQQSLKLEYTEDELCRAISGYRKSAFHTGKNEHKTVYGELATLLRDAAHIDAGLEFADKEVPQEWL